MTEKDMDNSEVICITSTSGNSQTVCRPELLPVYHQMMLDEIERLNAELEALQERYE